VGTTVLVIEQVPMRRLRTNGGLTRGRGMTEKQQKQRLIWLLSMPACVETNWVMQKVDWNAHQKPEKSAI